MVANTDPKGVFLLPKLKADKDVRTEAAGEWNTQPDKAFKDVAKSLEYSAPGQENRISSVPTMWARPLTIEMVLHDQNHPLHSKIVPQWEGMLAVLALAKIRNFPLTAQLIELGEVRHRFSDSLFDLRPDYKDRTLYEYPGVHPWQDVYVFLWNKKPVGMSSPSTLIVPSEEGAWDNLPWWNKGKRVLESPLDGSNKLNEQEQGLLWLWLKYLSQSLEGHNGNEDATNTIQTLISNFQTKLTQPKEKPADITTVLADEPQFFGVPINRGALIGLNRPVEAASQPSSVRIIPSTNKEGDKLPLLLYDPNMPGVISAKPQNIWIHAGKTLASLSESQLPDYQTRWQGEVEVIEKEDLFLEELSFIDLESALPGALFPDIKDNSPIIFNDKRITPLIPLNPILLDYFTPEDLIRRIRFQPLRGDGNQVRLTLTLPLTGVQKEGDDRQKRSNKKLEVLEYQLFKDYELNEANALIDQLPVLEIWPNFRAEGWKEYYSFYYDAELADEAFAVDFPDKKYVHGFKQGQGVYQMAKFDQFPEAIHCLDSNKDIIGLILLKSPQEITLRNKWSVGVDFGTSFSNVYINKNQTPEPLELKNLLVQVTQSNLETRLPSLFEYFIPEDFIPKEKPLPLSSVLTTQGNNERNQTFLPILDGRVYVPDNARFEPEKVWIKTNLKWLPENAPYLKLFIQVLALQVSALAASEGVKTIQWCLSYPSAFSLNDRTEYAGDWEDITTEMSKTTGITHLYPEISSDYFRTESLAVAQYFADIEGHNLVYTTCIDLGGGTSDISIFADNELVHQCSVQLAGRDIFSQILAMNRPFIEKRLKIDAKKWKGLEGGAFNAKLDVWLRIESENWLRTERRTLQNEEDLAGLVRITAIGMAGLYYYVGILLKTLYLEEKYKKAVITPVYIGGNGSRFLHWLDSRGAFTKNSEVNQLLSRMLSVGSEFEDTEQVTRLSTRPKDEAACGLVVTGTKLKGMDKKIKDPLIGGEAYTLKLKSEVTEKNISVKMPGESRLSPEEALGVWRSQHPEEAVDSKADDWDITDFQVTELKELAKFLYQFHKALKELNIQTITPINDFVRSPERDRNPKLWDETQRELDNLLLQLKEEAKTAKGKQSDKIRWEPSFILGLKALLRVLGKQWAEK
jgi:hypothetical protein